MASFSFWAFSRSSALRSSAWSDCIRSDSSRRCCKKARPSSASAAAASPTPGTLASARATRSRLRSTRSAALKLPVEVLPTASRLRRWMCVLVSSRAWKSRRVTTGFSISSRRAMSSSAAAVEAYSPSSRARTALPTCSVTKPRSARSSSSVSTVQNSCPIPTMGDRCMMRSITSARRAKLWWPASSGWKTTQRLPSADITRRSASGRFLTFVTRFSTRAAVTNSPSSSRRGARLTISSIASAWRSTASTLPSICVRVRANSPTPRARSATIAW
mmetsp:Transcript_7735/g.25672  ORF Transcript_7735/g.25672 Transcript_7735/m.25672 type:complete len:274 (-) Transcript_7735:1258-2079(-)